MKGVAKCLSILFVLIFISCQANQVQESAAAGTLKVSLPDLNWALQVALPDYQIEHSQMNPDGYARRLTAVSPTTNITLSMFIERVNEPGDSRACRDFYWSLASQSPLPKDSITMRDFGDLALVEYFVPEYRGIAVNQRHVNAYLARGNVWMDIHFSKPQFQPTDRALFDSLLSLITIDEQYTPDALENFTYGSTYYLRREWYRAIDYYEKALSQHKTQPTLDRDMWCVLVDNLGMAYGLSGNTDRAMEIFRYGISKDKTYPMFYYNLACAYGGKKDLDNALDNLDKASLYRENMLEGETLPDPNLDPSFAAFRNNTDFIEGLTRMGF